MSLNFDSPAYHPADSYEIGLDKHILPAGYDRSTVEGFLMENLLANLETAEKPTLPSIVMKDPKRKWHLVSAIQKSIRRGDADMAVKLAVAMHNSSEADHMWRRLAVCCLEDIGFANPELTATVMAVAGKKAWREKNGGAMITAYLVDRMAKTVKSRTFCHMLCYTIAAPHLQEANVHWCDLDFEEAEQLDHVASFLYQVHGDMDGIEEDPNIANGYSAVPLEPSLAVIASRALAGDLSYVLPGEDPSDYKAKRQKSSGSAALHDALLDDMEPALPEIWRYIITRGRGMGLENLYHAVPALWAIHAEELKGGDVEVDVRVLPPIELFTKLPSVAFDKHTLEGKRAIKQLAKNCDPIRGFLESHVEEEKRLAALGSAVFYAEGGEPMRYVLDSPSARVIQRSEHQVFAGKYGLTPEQFDELHELVTVHLGELNDARRGILE